MNTPRKLLERLLTMLHNQGNLHSQIIALAEADGLQLETAQLQQLEADPITFLLQASSPAPRFQRLSQPVMKPQANQDFLTLKSRIASRLLLPDEPLPENPEQFQHQVESEIDTLIANEGLVISRSERMRLIDSIIADAIGYGPLHRLLEDDTVTEIIIYHYDNIYAVRKGALRKQEIQFEDEAHIQRIMNRMMRASGRQLDDAIHHLDVQIAQSNGYIRITVAKPPVAVSGTIATIRKFQSHAMTLNDLVRYGRLSVAAAEFLRACVQSGLTILVSGNPGSGKTTLVNALASCLPQNAHIAILERQYETILPHEQVFRLQPTDAITLQQLADFAQHLNPEHIITGEITGAEASALIDLLPIVNSGIFAIRGYSSRDALSNLWSKAQLDRRGLPDTAIADLIASRIDIVIGMGHLQQGQRRILTISEVQGSNGDELQVADIFVYTPEEDQLRATGLRPRNLHRIEDAGIQLDPEIFSTGQQQ